MLTTTTRVSVTVTGIRSLSLAAKRVVIAISAPATEIDVTDREAEIYQDGYDDGYRDGFEAGIDVETCETCGDVH